MCSTEVSFSQVYEKGKNRQSNQDVKYFLLHLILCSIRVCYNDRQLYTFGPLIHWGQRFL